jgi:UDP-GlcNAc:undecaprenyl-phosphate GlcNAc-1-phosphate transferase
MTVTADDLVRAAFVLVVAAGLGALSTSAGKWLGERYGLVQVPGGRRKHSRPVSRLGGLGLAIGYCLTATGLYWLAPLPEDTNLHVPLLGSILGTAFAAAWGLVDDRFELTAGPQFFLQFLTALIACATAIIIEIVTLPAVGEFSRPYVFEPWITYPLTVFWVMGMMNTVNFLDGLDGLAAGVAAIAAAVFALHSFYRLGQNETALYSVALCGACLGFLVFNFHPARVFMGSAGAMSLGFALAALSIIAPARVMTALLVLAIPIADVAFQIVDRWRRGQNPMRGDRGHFHFQLSDLGLPQRPIVLGYYAVCLIYGASALLLESRWLRVGIFAALALAVFAALLWLRGRPKTG